MNYNIKGKYAFAKEVLNSFLQRGDSNIRSWVF